MSLEARLVALLREKSVRHGTFTLASGKVSDFYVDARQTTLHAEGGWLVGSLMLERLRPDVVGIGGMTLGADPIASCTATVAWAAGRTLHAFLIRKEAKEHGAGGLVVGLANLPPGSRVAIVEDTATTGGSMLKAVERAREAGLDVVQCLTVVDREEGAAAAVAAAGLHLEALATRASLTT